MFNRASELLNATAGSRGQRALVGLAGKLVLPLSPHYFGRACRVLRRLSPPAATCIVELNADTRFEFRLRDPYWTPLLSSAFHYEPELEGLLRSMRDVPYAFYDCGANYGYWSLMVSSAGFGAKRVIAVEALRPTYEGAETNRRVNGRSFILLHRAVARVSGQEVEIFSWGEDNHAGSSLLKEWVVLDGARHTEMVQTISLDDLIDQNPPAHDESVVIKLDVEGLEQEVLAGATRTLTRAPMIIYEDHGKDTECLVSCFVMRELGFAVFALSPAGKSAEVKSLDEIRSLKTNPTIGYNLAAVKPGSTLYRLLAARTSS